MKAAERELRLDVPLDFALPELAGTPLESRDFTSTYFDTPDGRLARVGVTLRRRVENGRSLWQLDLPVDDDRTELEEPGDPASPPDQLADLLVAVRRGQPLEPVVELRTRRRGVLVGNAAPLAEVVVDAVDVLGERGVKEQFGEVLVGLLRGDSSTVDDLARALRRAGAQRGGRPALGRLLGLERSAADGSRSKRLGDRLAAAMREQLADLLAHDPGVRLGRDAEAVHQMRVATRRLRAHLRAAEPELDRGWAEPLRAELKWLAGLLGAVRDLDVLLDRLRRQQAQLEREESAALDPTVFLLHSDHTRARTELVGALRSDRYLQLLDELERAPEAQAVTGLDLKVKKIAAGEFERVRKTVAGLGENPTDEQLHRTRVRAKRARYAAELAMGSTSGARGFVNRAKELQDVLGEHQDAVVAEERLRALAVGGDAMLGVAVGRLIERERLRRLEARAGWGQTWRRLERRGRRIWR
ncbi:MAG TPA: CYTH and CHAD domain-containing protein [Gaiellaceae bacterium]